MDPLVLTLTILSTVLAIFLVVLGIQAFLVLREAKKTLVHVNAVVDVVEHTVVRAILPLSNVGGFMSGLKGGMKMLETFVHFLKKDEDEE